MLAAVASCWALLLGMSLLMLGNGLQGSLLGLRAAIENFPTTVTGFVMSGYFIGLFLGSMLAPRFVGRVGHVRVFAALASLASASVLVHVIFLDPITWTAMRIVTGLSYAGLYIVAESWLNDRATNENRGQLLSIYMVVSLSSMAVGQLLLNLADPGGFVLFILVSVLVSIAVVPISLTAGGAPRFVTPRPVSPRELYTISPLGVLSSFGTGLAHGAFFGMGPVFAEKAGFSTAWVSYFMGLMLLGGVLCQWPVGRLSDRFDRRKIIAVTTFLAAAVAILAVPASHVSFWGFFVLVCLFGGLSLPLYSLSVAHTNDYLEPDQMVGASGTLVLIMGMGSILGPILTGFFMSGLGPNAFFLVLGGAHALIGVFALYRMTRRAPKPLAEQGPYVPVPRSPLGAAIAAGAVRDQMDKDLASMSRSRMMKGW